MAAAYEKSPAVEQPAYVGAHSPDSRSEEDVPYDSNDPMRWSWVKKHVYLTIVVMAAFLPDYASSSGIPLLQQQVKYEHIESSRNFAVLTLVSGSGTRSRLWCNAT